MWGIELRLNDSFSLSRQIFMAFAEHILSGQLPQGEALPSTRALARELGVSRNTVCEAYDMLLAEGYIVSHQGAPTRVSPGLQLSGRQAAPDIHPPAQKKAPPSIRWDFKTGQPDLSLFPWALWSRLIKEAAERLPVSQLGYGGTKGYEPLCEEIAQWLLRSRGMLVNPDDVFVTAGSTQALHILSSLLRAQGRGFALENPSHPAIHAIAVRQGFPILWMPVDEQGADVNVLAGQSVSAAYVTPSHQYPLGGILPAGRRAALIRLAKDQGFIIIEDDYDSEFRYGGAPVGPIYSMDASRVAYVGTFSKTVFPALRLGFAVLPKALQADWKRVRRFLDVQNPVLEQAAMAEFLRTRKMDKHVQRMRHVYREKRDVLLQAVEQAFGDSVHAWGDASGLHVALQFDEMSFDNAFVQTALERGLKLYPLSQSCVAPDCRNDILLMGYGHLTSEQIEEGVRVLRGLITP